MTIKLRDLIRAVRACKTAAEERAVISKECALIRTAIKEEDEQFRHRNVAKLMYIHMLGYPTHFGQMECLKLISIQTFPEKRIGYLGLTLLLNEQAEVLTLVTNSLKIDLTNPNQYIQALSLVAIGNLSTQDMARDLASDVAKLLNSNNAYLRKKAALATIRILKKEPDLLETMGDRIENLLKDRNHGVLITGIQLMIEILDLIPEMTEKYSKLVPNFVRLLRNFISMGFSPEHDVGGITDPFMQVKLLHILRKLGRGNEETSEAMNDVLAQVATNTETSKNAGNAILYECVQTIMDVQSDSGLRVLAVNILGRFLLNRDNNIRYVALNSLSRVVSDDISAVQRHRNTIVDCLKDADVSIRNRALELIYQLVNDQNVVALMAELLNYLVVASTEQKPSLSSRIMQIVERYSPNPKWRVDTIVTLLTLAGNGVDDSVARNAIIFLSQAQALHSYLVHKLYRCVMEDSSQTPLLQVTSWCVGEYGDLLSRVCTLADTDAGVELTFPAISEADIIALLDRSLRLHNADIPTKAIILTALVKLTCRLSPSCKPTISALIAPFRSSLALELQQRSLEYCKLLSGPWDGVRGELLVKMPVLDEATLRRKRGEYDDNADETPTGAAGGAVLPLDLGTKALGGGLMASGSAGGPSLLDLDDIFGGGKPSTPSPSAASSGSVDLLSDIFSLSAISPSPTLAPTPSTPNVLDLFGPSPSLAPAPSLVPTPLMPTPPPNMMSMGMGMGMTPSPSLSPSLPPNMNMNNMMGLPPQPPVTLAPASPIASNPLIKAFDKGGFQVIMDLSKPTPSTPSLTKIICKFLNTNPVPIQNLTFQAAVPKYLKLEMLPPSSTTIPPSTPGNANSSVTQEIRVTNTQQGEKNIMLKLKILYSLNGTPVEEMAQVSNFPPLY